MLHPDCEYQHFIAKLNNLCWDFCNKVALKVVEDQTFFSFYTKAIKQVYVNCSDEYGVDSLAGLLCMILMEIITSACEHYQIRQEGFYKTTMKTKKPFTATPVTSFNTQYLLDAYQRILFRTVFSGDYPIRPLSENKVFGFYDEFFDRPQLKQLCDEYSKFINYDTLCVVCDY